MNLTWSVAGIFVPFRRSLCVSFIEVCSVSLIAIGSPRSLFKLIHFLAVSFSRQLNTSVLRISFSSYYHVGPFENEHLGPRLALQYHQSDCLKVIEYHHLAFNCLTRSQAPWDAIIFCNIFVIFRIFSRAGRHYSQRTNEEYFQFE